MNFNEHYFSFPPHLSTSWENISAITTDHSGRLVLHLSSGDSITIPPISDEEAERIFNAHAHYLENRALKDHTQIKSGKLPSPMQRNIMEAPIRFSFGTLEGLNSAMQHNPAESAAPNLPEEMLGKLREISKILAPPDPELLPKAEPHCNCYHCQLARAIQGSPPIEPLIQIEEEVLPSELEFKEWEIEKVGDNLYTVRKVNEHQTFNVFLGSPVGCTCGQEGCDHVLAVLKS